MKTLIIIMLIFGLFELLSNLLHLSKGSKIKIGESAKKQHQELPLDAGLNHFYYKAIIMFGFGILFLLSSLTYFLADSNTGIIFTRVNSILMSVYGLIQLIIYYRTYKVWTSFLVYCIPLIAYFIIA
jgi:hypothetical protein